jgi:hypothetical protein
LNREQPWEFCAKCTAESTEQTPGNISTINGIGRKFYGSAEPCPTCGSTVRTLWWTLVELPMIPLGSYRYQLRNASVSRSQFWARKTQMRWGQVLKTWIVGLAIGAIVITAIVMYDLHKQS